MTEAQALLIFCIEPIVLLIILLIFVSLYRRAFPYYDDATGRHPSMPTGGQGGGLIAKIARRIKRQERK